MPDPAAALRKLVRYLRPGGVVVFHELDWDGARSAPPVPTYDRCCRWIAQTFQQSGAETNMGVRLHSVFVAADLPSPKMQLRAVIGAGSDCLEAVQLVTDLVGRLVPAMERLGVATALEVDHASLADRIMTEARPGSSIVGRAEVGAWSRV
jgi:hypothetical protein